MTVSWHTKSLIDMADKSSVDWPPLGQANGSSWAESVGTLGASAGDSLEQTTSTTVTIPIVPVAAGQLTRRPETKISQHHVQKSRVLKEKNATSARDGVKGVSRRLHAFVSRLEASTTEQQLSEWLAKVGISALPAVVYNQRMGALSRLRHLGYRVLQCMPTCFAVKPHGRLGVS